MLKNRKCNYCGREYYCCKSCISINSWKNVCCSIDCYRHMIQNGNINMPQEIKNKEGEVMKTLLRAALNNKDTADIIGYDLELGKFDCSDGKTRTFDDFLYFIVPTEEMKEIVDFFVQKEQKLTEMNKPKQTRKKEVRDNKVSIEQ